MLTDTFAKVLKEIESLNEYEQNELADLIHEELKWSATLEGSQDALSILANEALKEHKNGMTKEINC